MKTDAEIQKTFKVFLGKDDILEAVFLERQTDHQDELRQAQLMLGELLDYFKTNPNEKFNFLIDLSPMGKSSYVMGRNARSYYKENLMPEKIKKMAIITESAVIKTLITFVLMAIRQKNISFFTSKEEALAWIKK